MTDLTIAKQILAQLGGNRFVAMTGAKNLVAGPTSLSMHLPRGFAAKGIDRVTVALDPSDTYTVTFGKWFARRLEVVEVEAADGIYCDMLQSTFTAATGLDCRM